MIISKTLEPEIYASCILRQPHYMVIKSYIYHRKNFRMFFLQLIPILTLFLHVHSNSFIMVFNMRVVPVFMLQMTSISGQSIISCYCAIKSKRYSIISFFPYLWTFLCMNLRSSKEDNSAIGFSTRSPPSMIARLLDVDCQQHGRCFTAFWLFISIQCRTRGIKGPTWETGKNLLAGSSLSIKCSMMFSYFYPHLVCFFLY